MTVRVGDIVVLDRLPPWVTRLPSESQAVFESCVGRAYPLVEIDEQGLYVLDVSADVDAAFGGRFNDIRVEEAYLRLASSKSAG